MICVNSKAGSVSLSCANIYPHAQTETISRYIDIHYERAYTATRGAGGCTTRNIAVHGRQHHRRSNG